MRKSEVRGGWQYGEPRLRLGIADDESDDARGQLNVEGIRPHLRCDGDDAFGRFCELGD